MKPWIYDDSSDRDEARRIGVRVVEYWQTAYGYGPGFMKYRVQKRRWFGIWWTQATYDCEIEAVAAAMRLARGEPLHGEPRSPVVWP